MKRVPLKDLGRIAQRLRNPMMNLVSSKKSASRDFSPIL
jgi:hypothetical protein